MIALRFESKLFGSRERVWEWIISADGIAAELRPFFRMTVPDHMRAITDVAVELGTPLFRSDVYLFGIVPIDRSELTLIELDVGRGFVEESPMRTMRKWRHERRIADDPSDPAAVVVTDQLTFEPRRAPALVGWFIGRVFRHRHRVLRARFGVPPARP